MTVTVFHASEVSWGPCLSDGATVEGRSLGSVGRGRALLGHGWPLRKEDSQKGNGGPNEVPPNTCMFQSQHLEPVGMTLFGKSVLADMIKVTILK